MPYFDELDRLTVDFMDGTGKFENIINLQADSAAVVD